jgi:pullulanase
LASQHELATIIHHRETPGIGYFNDLFREKVKHLDELDLVYDMLSKRNQYLSLTQSINYVECHDNETLYDFLAGDFEKHQLMTMLTILAPGIPFIHAGQEFFRTKEGVENSYCSPDEINALDWSRADRYRIYTDFVRSLLAFRKHHPSLTHPEAHVSVFEEQGLKIFQYDFLDDQVRLVVNLSNRKIARPVDAVLYSHQIEARHTHLQEIHAFSAVVL